ncbi:MAG TPA: hypothetical protein ENN80_00325 [Candidatus Hydrogenedentes bacterium]|nr:hypothetical protein [Candidatus Hydrogenedentota bacterium]
MWRFLHVSDPHLGSDTDGEWNNRFLCTMMPEVMACLRRDIARFEPDFILATGDIASKQTREAMFVARDLMDLLGVPYYPMGGNHDFALEEARGWFVDAFGTHLPTGETTYAFAHKNLRFCILDPWWLWSDGTLQPFSEGAKAATMDKTLAGMRWAVPQEQLAWLEEELTNHADVSTIVATHYPAVCIPERLRRPGLNDAGRLANGDELIGLLGRFSHAKAIFSGHVHMHFIEPLSESLTQVVTGALPEFPVEFRCVDVHEECLEITTHGLSDGGFAERSLIPGKEWTAGAAQDRTATLRLG